MITYYLLMTGLFIFNAIAIYIAYIQRIKSNKYKKLYTEAADKLEEIESSVESVIVTMKNIDNSGAFEADDEVGIIFKSLKTILFKHFNIEIENKNGRK